MTAAVILAAVLTPFALASLLGYRHKSARLRSDARAHITVTPAAPEEGNR